METPLKFDRRRRRVKRCPCGRSNKDGKFCPYDGYDDKGYCHSCGMTFIPTEDKESQHLIQFPCNSAKHFNKVVNKVIPVFSSIPDHYLQGSLKGYDQNNIITFLRSKFPHKAVERVTDLYQLGSSDKIKGSVVFWYIDKDGKVRSGKVMQYNPVTGKRVKEGYNNINWVHKLAGIEDFVFRPCLFGEHLIVKEPDKPTFIVESEKTAIICSLQMPQFIWVATGGMQNFKPELLAAVKQKKVIAIPDLGAYESWKAVVDQLGNGFKITVSTFLEKQATSSEKELKLDIGDYLLKYSSTITQ